MKTSKAYSLVIGLTTAALILSFAGASLAQSQPLKATIPFDFYAGDKLMRAGVYTITPNANGAIYIGNLNGGTFMLTNRANTTGARNSLVFSRYGDISFLTKLQWAGTSTGREVLPTKLENEARLRMSPVQLAVFPK